MPRIARTDFHNRWLVSAAAEQESNGPKAKQNRQAARFGYLAGLRCQGRIGAIDRGCHVGESGAEGDLAGVVQGSQKAKSRNRFAV
jgi:hypothetical protein